ncbi:hypothetical protein CROQUDRAFT_36427 [Cronartium quercuum f. sp. fusiforme G11]|uniref:SET domain-containing protein n=1 Tax=Cronartium quercuum f. sp. fusiforme G11 TaxID=708437 RepID=A0A9P6TGH2_9BASI|nr:hypothetical protein CROQUDRAFT_36427 [Cronartium quercuum f. sp. fusiforme G11]
MVDLLPIKGRELFARQHGVGDTELDWISSAFDRNVFSASKDDEGHGGFAFIPEPAVNLNHDCRPNVAYYFDDLTLQLEMFAIRDIAPGEELFDSSRQDTLYHHYGFKCKCSQCNLPPWAISISDDRIEQIHQLSAVLSNWTAQPPPTTAMAEHLIALYKMEHMEAAIDTPYSLASLAYNSYGESDKASMYASIAISYGIYINGPDWPSYQAHAMLEKEPKNHWSYRSRLPNGPAGPKPDANVEATEEKKETTFSIISEESK